MISRTEEGEITKREREREKREREREEGERIIDYNDSHPNHQ